MDEYNKKKLELKNFLEIGLYVFLAVAATYFLLMFVGQRTSVHGSSMYPTLKDGDQLIVEKVTKLFHRQNALTLLYLMSRMRKVTKRFITSNV